MNICIIQARMGSSRLPGKVLRPIAGKPILQHVVERLTPSGHIDKILVATTTNEEDLAIAQFCESKSIPCYCGSDWDVLDRFVQAAKFVGATSDDTIIRICCDNPIHSYKVVDFVMEEFLKLQVDYFSNSNQEPDYLEDGFDTEVTTYSALLQAHEEATLLSEREHVMPYIKNCGKFKLGWRKANADYQFKLSVDTENDFKAAETIFTKLHSNADFSIDEVVNLLKEQPQILEINQESTINSGYAKSLQTDRKIK